MYQQRRGRIWRFLHTLSLVVFFVVAVAHAAAESPSSISGTSSSQGQRTLHRLVGGHIRTPVLDFDDAELIITSSAGGGREGKTKSEGEEKKTLSQQVADGKYGLIQNELFAKPIKKPGIISYESNPEVPKDNINNLGGLNKNDIWLAENHLLVIRGGGFGEHDSPPTSHDAHGHQVWPAIDDYQAPGRQVKLPSNPKVPPPFPVQLTDDGPLQILGTNYTTAFNGSLTASPYPLPAEEGGGGLYAPPFQIGGNPYSTNLTAGETPFPIPPFPPEFGPPPFAINGSIPPFFANLPPGAAILPPPGNSSVEYDEDDPSIYYPPPYSFYYQMDNSTQVPPGPLVPGIVLPPPPNFFAPLENKPATNNKARKKPGRVTTTTTTMRPFTSTTTDIPKQIRPTTTPIPPTPVKPNRYNNPDNYYTIKPKTQTQTPRVVIRVEDTTPQPKPPPRVVTIYPVRHHYQQPINTTKTSAVRPKPESVTVLKPVQPVIKHSLTSTPSPVYFYENSVKPFKIYGPPPTRARTAVTSTQIPLKAYYNTPTDIDSNSVVTQSPEPDYYTPRTTTKSPRQYYYYEEQPHANSITTQRTPKAQNFFSLPQDYYLPAKPTVRENYQAKPVLSYQNNQGAPQQYYHRQPSRPSRYRFIETTKKPDTFSIHVARLKQQIHQYYTTPDPYNHYEAQRNQPSPKPVYQFSFQAANYKPPQQVPSFKASPIDNNDDDKFRPINKYNVEIQPAIEVLPTRETYQNPPPPARYYRPKQIPQTSTPAPLPPPKYYNVPVRPDYDYEEVEIKQKPRYPTATPKPISQYSFDATPNPIYQPYYTKPDHDSYLDDITQKYFTIFGKKIPGQTTPLPRAPLPKRPVQIEYAPNTDKEVSLQGDTIVNYVRPRPIEPQAEYIRPRKPVHHLQPVQQVAQSNLQSAGNLNAEIVQAIPVNIATSAEGKPGSFISYELPGDDGAHFYFLTPQLAQSRDQGAGFYFENPNAQQLKHQQQLQYQHQHQQQQQQQQAQRNS